jgi:hypothetical protein
MLFCGICVIVGALKAPGTGPCDTKLDEDEHRYGERNGLQVMATLRSLA